MDKLRFTPSIIRSIENEKKTSLVSLMTDQSVDTIFLFVKKGLLSRDDDEVDSAIGEYLKGENEKGEKNDMLSLYFYILDSLQDQGFLPRALKLQEMKDKMIKALKGIKDEEKSEQEPLQVSGN